MATIHWLGAGLSSVPGIQRIAGGSTPLVLWNRTIEKAQEAAKGFEDNVSVRQLDWQALKDATSAGDVVISMLPATMHLQVAQLCLEQDAHFVSSSYVSPEMAALDKQAKDKGLCFVNEVGLDPGIDHLMAHILVDQYRQSAQYSADNKLYFRSYCGGFPAVANDFKYKFSWSPLGVLKALKSPAKWLNGGEESTTNTPWKAVKDYESIVESGKETFQAYPNRDSLPFMQDYQFDDNWNVQEFIRGTLRLNGWTSAWKDIFDLVESVKTDADMQKLEALSDDLWNKYSYNQDEADRVVLSVELEARNTDNDVVWHSSYNLDEKGNEKGSAMARLVSLTVSIAIESLLKGELPKGVSAAPSDSKVASSWLETLSNLGENIHLNNHV